MGGKALLMVEAKPVLLCVDDEEIPLMLRKLVLEKAGYDVVTASSAPKALEIVSSRHIDLVLSDHLMPGSTGAELARQIKSRLPELPVVLLSGVNEVPSDAGYADLFLSKAVGPVSLCENIAKVLDGTRARNRDGVGPS
jgi:CheY-like chemotaxis protein